MRRIPLLRCVLLLSLAQGVPATTFAEPVPVLHPQGSAHGFVEVTTMDGRRLGVGDLLQRLRGDVVTSRLTLHFRDGSLDDETTVYSQRGAFRLISDHHVQKGPSFPKAMDSTVEVDKGMISSLDDSGQMQRSHLDLPADVYNGMASSLLMNVDPATPETRIALVISGSKPRLVHLSIKNAGNVPVTIGGVRRQVTDFDAHVELGGVAGVVAPLVGKQPLDYHVWLMTGQDPAFIREEGQLYEDGPLWSIQQISAVLPK